MLVLRELWGFVVRRAISLLHPVLLIVCGGELIAAQLHALQLLGLPPVHLQGPHKRYVHAEIPMHGCALIAEEYPNVGRGPFGILTFAIETHLLDH